MVLIFEYLGDVLDKKKEVGDKYLTPGFGLASQFFYSIAKFVVERSGPIEGENLLKLIHLQMNLK